jgi:beta-fructofuranosidase
VWECPNFFLLGDRPMLVFSAWDEGRTAYSVIATGGYAGGRLTIEQASRLDYGDHHFYAPQVMRDPAGRALMWGWIQEGRPQDAADAAGWSGVMSLPRELYLGADGGARMRPAEELKVLRGAEKVATDIALEPDNSRVALARGAHLDIEVEFEPPERGACGLCLRRSPQEDEVTLLYYDADARVLALDRRASTLDDAPQRDIQSGPLTLEAGEPLCLRVLVDGSVIEVFANERACLTSRVYPTRADSVGVTTFATGAAMLRSFRSWEMGSIWGTAR